MAFEHSPFADLSGLTRLARGNHYSHFYDGAEDLAEAVVPFIATGVRNNEQCLWVTAEPLERADAIAALAQLLPDLDQHLACGRIEIVDHKQWYAAAGGLCAETVIAKWLERERLALEGGYAGLRITGNTFWLDTPAQYRDFGDYERSLHRALRGRNITCLCSYCINKGSGRDILDIVAAHDFAMIRRGGQWDVIESASLKMAKSELNERLAQKERLLTEIHHRVKNNLQIVTSLLLLKSRHFGEAERMALDDTIARISAMALVHEMLYEQDDCGFINILTYARRLAQQLSVAYDCRGRIAIDVVALSGELPMLELDKAIPLGIAITEAITNAIKHAFPDGRSGRVWIELSGTPAEIRLRISDDGRAGTTTSGGEFGPAARGGEFGPAARGGEFGSAARGGEAGAGLSLIRGLARQIEGTVEISARGGFTLTFQVPVNGVTATMDAGCG